MATDALKKSQELIETLTDISVQAEQLAPIASKIALQVQRATKFMVRCFHCGNAEKTERDIIDDSIKIRKTRNVYQVKGTCAHCQHTVAGFLPTAKATKLATDRNLPIEVLPPKEKDTTTPRKRKTTKRKADEMAEPVIGEVGEPEPAAKENKQ